MAKTTATEFVQQVRQELTRITWPTRKELVATTLSVLAMSAFAAACFFVVDQVIAFGVQVILGLGA